MARQGRKRKPGKRQPKGRLSETSRQAANMTAQFARLVETAKTSGLPAELGHSLGREFYHKHITKEQFEAGLMWAAVVEDFWRVKGYPKGSPKSPFFERKIPATGEGQDVSPDVCDAITRKHDRAHSALWAAGLIAERTVNRVCVEGLSCELFNREQLKTGLTVLAEHFGLKERK